MNWLQKTSQLETAMIPDELRDRIQKAFHLLEEARKAFALLQDKRWNVKPKKPYGMDRAAYDNPVPYIEQILAKAEETYKLADEYRKSNPVESWYDEWIKNLWSERYLLHNDFSYMQVGR